MSSARERRGIAHVSPVTSSVTRDTVESRAASRSVEVRLVKLKSEDEHYRSSSVEDDHEDDTEDREDTAEEADPGADSADPDWEDNEEEEKEVGDDDPEYDPESADNSKKNS